MQYRKLPDGEKIPVLGLGTWRVGGGMSPNYSQDGHYINIIRKAIELGYIHIDTAEMYGRGHTEELVGQAIRDFQRKEVFITTKVSPENLRYQQVLQACEASLKRLGLDYVDLYLIHWPGSTPMEETFRALNQLVAGGKVRHLGVSNFDLKQLKKAQSLSETPLVTNQVPYSLTNRRYANNGVLAHCQENNILLTAYTPFSHGAALNHIGVTRLAQKYGATPAQIALYWLIRQPNVITIPMTSREEHLASNLKALKLELEPDDLKALVRA